MKTFLLGTAMYLLFITILIISARALGEMLNRRKLNDKKNLPSSRNRNVDRPRVWSGTISQERKPK